MLSEAISMETGNNWFYMLAGEDTYKYIKARIIYESKNVYTGTRRYL